MRIIYLLLLALYVSSCGQPSLNYETFEKAQDYNVPLWDKGSKRENPVALFIFPHPDDEIVCAGTIATLKQQGWKVNLLTLTQGKPEEKEIRKAEWQNAVKALAIDGSQLLDLPNNSWEDIQANKLHFWDQQMDSVRNIIYNAIKQYSPSLLFTYDEVMGGYGHPEHRLTASATHKVFEQHKDDSSFAPIAIMQITLSDQLEKALLGSLDSYKKAVAGSGKDLPAPDIAFDITSVWPVKGKAASVYTSQYKTLRKFYLLPDQTDTTKHYSAFSREYYTKVIK